MTRFLFNEFPFPSLISLGIAATVFLIASAACKKSDAHVILNGQKISESTLEDFAPKQYEGLQKGYEARKRRLEREYKGMVLQLLKRAAQKKKT